MTGGRLTGGRRVTGTVPAVAALIAALTLTACAERRSDAEVSAPLWRETPLNRTVFELPAPPRGNDGGDGEAAPRLEAIAAFRKAYDDGSAHRVILGNETGLPGENTLRANVHLGGPGFFEAVGRGAAEHTLPRIEPDEDWLEARRAALFPDMATATEVGSGANAHGPYNFTSVRGADGETCILAWQVLDDDAPSLPRAIERFTVRFRFCHPTAGEDGITDLFEGIEYVFARALGPGADAR